MLNVHLIVGARPNFMKAAPILSEMRKRPKQFSPTLIHTGQHYDAAMSTQFFDELGLPQPDYNLGVGSGTHAEQTARIMLGYEPIATGMPPDWTIVVGDVNSTIACALVAVKLGIRVAHVEAGLRSRDRTMPEEINRILTDSIADLLLTTEPTAEENLRNEGIDSRRIRFVGNVMIDSLLANLRSAERSDILSRCGLESREFVAVTLHRPSNVDSPETLSRIIAAMREISRRVPVIFPVHPRTRETLRGIETGDITLTEPLGYLDFLRLFSQSKLVLTDSGGLQEETTALGIPCLTLRENTERPVTVEMGTNKVIGTNTERIVTEALRIIESGLEPNNRKRPPLWDGRAAVRICDEIIAASS
ncbi:MAG: UDP-N-acetylglucosamine 2-epimerase (non-hydrolyzing) [Blastocatellia bacterium]